MRKVKSSLWVRPHLSHQHISCCLDIVIQYRVVTAIFNELSLMPLLKMQIIEVGVRDMRNVLSLPKCDYNYIQDVRPPAGAVNCLQCTYGVYYFVHSKQMSAKRMFVIWHLQSTFFFCLTHYPVLLIRDKNMGPQVLPGCGTTKTPSLL